MTTVTSPTAPAAEATTETGETTRPSVVRSIGSRAAAVPVQGISLLVKLATKIRDIIAKFLGTTLGELVWGSTLGTIIGLGTWALAVVTLGGILGPGGLIAVSVVLDIAVLYGLITHGVNGERRKKTA